MTAQKQKQHLFWVCGNRLSLFSVGGKEFLPETWPWEERVQQVGLGWSVCTVPGAPHHWEAAQHTRDILNFQGLLPVLLIWQLAIYVGTSFKLPLRTVI